jgi:hypothetical protein
MNLVSLHHESVPNVLSGKFVTFAFAYFGCEADIHINILPLIVIFLFNPLIVLKIFNIGLLFMFLVRSATIVLPTCSCTTNVSIYIF